MADPAGAGATSRPAADSVSGNAASVDAPAYDEQVIDACFGLGIRRQIRVMLEVQICVLCGQVNERCLQFIFI